MAPQPVYRGRIRELVPLSLEQMVPTADLIVHGVVELRGTSRIRRPDGVVYRLFGHPSSDTRTAERRHGIGAKCGTADYPEALGRENRVGRRVGHSRGSRPPGLSLGEELLLVLVYDSADGKYRIAADIFPERLPYQVVAFCRWFSIRLRREFATCPSMNLTPECGSCGDSSVDAPDLIGLLCLVGTAAPATPSASGCPSVASIVEVTRSE